MKRSVLVFFSFRSHKRRYIEMLFERLSAAARTHPIDLSRGSLKDLHIRVAGSRLMVTDSLTGRDLAAFDALYFELWYKAQQQALAAALYAKRKGIPFFSEEILGIMPINKVGEIAALADAGVPLPETFTSSNREIKRVFGSADAPLSFPLIVKAADGYGGKNNFLVKDYPALCAVLDEHKDLTFVVQGFVPNDCDYRCLVIGGTIRLVLQRTRDAGADTHLNNTSQGAEGKAIPIESLAEVVRRDVVRATEVLGRSQFAGVDVLIDKQTGQHYILEVNQTPQIEIGAAVDQKMDALLGYMHELAAGS